MCKAITHKATNNFIEESEEEESEDEEDLSDEEEEFSDDEDSDDYSKDLTIEEQIRRAEQAFRRRCIEEGVNPDTYKKWYPLDLRNLINTGSFD